MRLDRPIGTWLLLLPGWWAILLTGGLSAWPIMILFAIGAVVMRGAGCVVNDLWDRDLDGSVERTATRPIPNGDVTIRQALIFLCALLLLGLAILLQLNGLTILIGIISILFIAVYPLMKRITWWPQAFLGLTFNFGAIMGWAAMTDELPWQAWLLYASGFFWTLGYDTIYAMQDRNDDALIGIKSSARWLTERYKGNIQYPLYAFYGIHFAGIVCVILSMQWAILPMLLLTVPLIHLLWQVKTLSISNPANQLKRFKSNRDYGLLVCGVIILFSYIS
jgi:4-hydroxybenzoate polyprenyltransferase